MGQAIYLRRGFRARSVASQQAAIHAGIAVVGAGAFRIPDQIRQDALDRLAGSLEHLGAKLGGIVALAIVGLYRRGKGVDHGHRRVGAAEKPGAELNAAGAIDLVTVASLLEHRRRCDELVEKRRFGVAERCGSQWS